VRSLREQKAHADMELEDARAVVEQADADISRAEAHFAAGKVPESALDVRTAARRSKPSSLF
jgi:multidrug resistance efflux pump